MKIAIAQMTSVDSFEKNLEQIENSVRTACAEPSETRPEIIFFPENSIYFRIVADEKLPHLALDSSTIQALEKLSADSKISLHLTSGILSEGKVWNASLLIHPGSSAKIVYKKIHLFDIALEGEKAIRESDVFSHGDSVTNFNLKEFKFGSSICYDLRFSELYHQHGLDQVDAIVVPAAFLVKTGRVHWEVLLKARAIENQCYVIAPAQTGIHKSTKSPGQQRETFGHSLLISPWGEIVQLKADGVGLIYGQMNKGDIETVRRQIPMKNHRRIK